jgi:hypothetical protein
MSVPGIQDPKQIPVSQISRGLDDLWFSCSCNATNVSNWILKRCTSIFRLPEHT